MTKRIQSGNKNSSKVSGRYTSLLSISTDQPQVAWTDRLHFYVTTQPLYNAVFYQTVNGANRSKLFESWADTKAMALPVEEEKNYRALSLVQTRSSNYFSKTEKGLTRKKRTLWTRSSVTSRPSPKA